MEHDSQLNYQHISITQLLILKRYELPPQEYFDNFLDKLRERLTMETSLDDEQT